MRQDDTLVQEDFARRFTVKWPSMSAMTYTPLLSAANKMTVMIYNAEESVFLISMGC